MPPISFIAMNELDTFPLSWLRGFLQKQIMAWWTANLEERENLAEVVVISLH
jgi:hypothetical protein